MDPGMNRRELMKLLGFGVVAPAVVAKALSPRDDKIHLADVLEMKRVGERSYPDPSDVRPHSKTTVWQPGDRTITNFDNPKNWSNGVPRAGDTAVLETKCVVSGMCGDHVVTGVKFLCPTTT